MSYAALVGVWFAVMAFLVACGDNGDGDNDTLLTGFSGVIIIAIAIWFGYRAWNKSRGD